MLYGLAIIFLSSVIGIVMTAIGIYGLSLLVCIIMGVFGWILYLYIGILLSIDK